MNKIKCLVILFLLAFSVSAHAAGTCWNGGSSVGGTTPWTVLNGSGGSASAAYADVEYCVNHVAANGETVNVTATGSVNWASRLTMDRAVSLIGPGAANLTIVNAYDAFLIRIHPSSYSTTKDFRFRISGFKFDSATYYGTIEIGNQNTAPGFDMQTVIIDHNEFMHSGTPASGAFAIMDRGSAYGVVYHNIFTGRYPIKADGGQDRSVSTTWWGTTPQGQFVLGSNKFLYFEDNVFTCQDGYGITDAQFSARFAYRYNTINMPENWQVAWELHGEAGTGHIASHGSEVYGNDLQAGSYSGSQFYTRSGQNLVFMNNTQTSGSAYNNVAYVDDSDAAAIAANAYQVCPEYLPADKIIHNNYWFRNYKNLNSTLIGVSGQDHDGTACTAGGNRCLDCNSLNDIPTAGRDVIGDATSPADVGCGSTLPGTCTVNDGYWVTAQSNCSNLTGYVGADTGVTGGSRTATNVISGTLYKCTATNTWTEFYTPYTYPHPLRGESDVTAPTATWTIDSTGLIATATFSETVNATTKTGVSFTGSVTGAIGATYKDGMPGGIVRYDLAAEVQQGETVVVDYTTPGDGIKDLAGNALADISDGAVSNNSTQADPPLVTLTIGAHTGSTVNVYPGINCGSTCGPVEYDTGTVLTVSVTALPNYTGCTIGGTGCGASTTMSEARSCTVTCTKIAPDYTLGSGAVMTIGGGAAATIQ